MKSDTIETIIWIFAIAVFVMLIVKIQYEAKDYSCSNCEVTLVNTVAGGQPYEFGTFNIGELFEEYNNGNCEIVWSSSGGYSYG